MEFNRVGRRHKGSVDECGKCSYRRSRSRSIVVGSRSGEERQEVGRVLVSSDDNDLVGNVGLGLKAGNDGVLSPLNMPQIESVH